MKMSPGTEWLRAEPDRPTVVDLFCGAGGLSLGFIAAGFEIVRAIDNDRVAVETYSSNVGDEVIELDVTDEIEVPGSTVIIGGPPCQGFSSAGLRKVGDKRNTLVSRFASIVARMRPKAFVFENVEGFLTAENGDYVLDLLTPLIASGYQIHVRKVNAANYGVPQHRKRVIAIGGLGWPPSFPEFTHSAFGAPGARLAGAHLPKSPTLEQALQGLPPPTCTPPGSLFGHYYHPLEGVDLLRARALKPGETMRDLPIELWHESFQRRAFRRVMDGTPTDRRGGAPAGVKRLCSDLPSKAITGGSIAEFIHPHEDRNLTVRECARLQTFPDTFEFVGTLSQQSRLIGNAVPPLLAEKIASQLARDLRSAPSGSGGGTILSFVPTLSEGVSPALKRVMERVRAIQFPAQSPEQLTLWL